MFTLRFMLPVQVLLLKVFLTLNNDKAFIVVKSLKLSTFTVLSAVH